MNRTRIFPKWVADIIMATSELERKQGGDMMKVGAELPMERWGAIN